MRSTPGDSVRPSGNVLGIEFSCRHEVGEAQVRCMAGRAGQLTGPWCTGQKQLKECAPRKVLIWVPDQAWDSDCGCASACASACACACPLRLFSAPVLCGCSLRLFSAAVDASRACGCGCSCPLRLPSAPVPAAAGALCACPLRLHPLMLLGAAPAGSRRAPRRLGCSGAAGAWRCCGWWCTSAEGGKRQGGCVDMGHTLCQGRPKH